MRFTRNSLMIIGLGMSVSLALSCSSKKPHKGAVNSAETGVVGEGNEVGQPAPGEGGETPPAPETEPGANKPNNKVEQLSSAYGLLNFRQVQHTLGSLTGVALNAAAPTGGVAPLVEYGKALSGLPADFAPAAITAGKVAALTKLSAVYCDVLANTPALLTAKFPGLSLAAAPADSAAFAKTIVDGFYGPESSLQGTRATDIQTVAATVDALKGFNGTGPAIFMATCAAVAASAEFFLY